jgi:hypothetical protein
MTAVLVPLCIFGFIVLALVDRASAQWVERREAARRVPARKGRDEVQDLTPRPELDARRDVASVE